MAQGFTKNIPIDTDVNLALDSDLLVPSQHAVKTFVENQLTFSADYPIEYDSNSKTFSAVGSRIKRALTSVVTVESGYTQLFRSPLIGTGGGIIIEADAEAYIL